MNELMAITREEYLELVNKIDSLQASLDVVSDPYVSVWNMLTEKPIEDIQPANSKNIIDPDFKYRSSAYEPVWKLLSELVRRLHSVPKDFYIHVYDAPRWRGEREIRPVKNKRPLYHKEMTQNQRQIGADMLSEIVPIYNRYVKMIHNEATYTNLNGEIEKISIVDPYESERNTK